MFHLYAPWRLSLILFLNKVEEQLFIYYYRLQRTACTILQISCFHSVSLHLIFITTIT